MTHFIYLHLKKSWVYFILELTGYLLLVTSISQNNNFISFFISTRPYSVTSTSETYVEKKNSTCEGQAAPRALHVRRGLLTQAEKIPKPPPPPLHRPLDTRAVALVRTGRPSGRCLHVLWCGGRRGDFF